MHKKQNSFGIQIAEHILGRIAPVKKYDTVWKTGQRIYVGFC